MYDCSNVRIHTNCVVDHCGFCALQGKQGYPGTPGLPGLKVRLVVWFLSPCDNGCKLVGNHMLMFRCATGHSR